MGFSAVGSLREEVKPRDFCVGGGVVDWTKGVREFYFVCPVLRLCGGEGKAGDGWGRKGKGEADV